MEKPKTGIELIAKERQKQIDKHGFTVEHSVSHNEWYAKGQLIQASLEILKPDTIPTTPDNWDKEWFKNLTERSHKERLVIAAALIAAELDRIELLENS